MDPIKKFDIGGRALCLTEMLSNFDGDIEILVNKLDIEDFAKAFNELIAAPFLALATNSGFRVFIGGRVVIVGVWNVQKGTCHVMGLGVIERFDGVHAEQSFHFDGKM